MEKKRPRARKKNVTGESKGIERRGEGVGGEQIGGFFGRLIKGAGSSKSAKDRGPKGGSKGGAW